MGNVSVVQTELGCQPRDSSGLFGASTSVIMASSRKYNVVDDDGF